MEKYSSDVVVSQGGYLLGNNALTSKGRELRIGIITVCLNSAPTLEHAITSVLAQSYPYIEHIIVDGGSKDGTLQILEKYSDKVAYWLSEKDRCASEGCNKGIKLATADILMFLSADDFLETDFCEKMVKCFESNPAIDYVYGDIVMCDKGGQPLYKVVGERINYFGVKRHVYQELGGYDESLFLNNDLDFLKRMENADKRGGYLELIRYMRAGGMSQVHRLKNIWIANHVERKNQELFFFVQLKFVLRMLAYFLECVINCFFGLKGLIRFYTFKSDLKKKIGMN